MKKLPKSWRTVTPFSKGLALVLFITLPIAGYFFGRYVQKQTDLLEMPRVAACTMVLPSR